MIVRDFDTHGIAIVPTKADTPLIVYAYTPLTCPISLEKLQPVARRYPQAIDLGGCIDLFQLSARNVLDFRWPLLDLIARKDRCCALVGESLDHGQ